MTVISGVDEHPARIKIVTKNKIVFRNIIFTTFIGILIIWDGTVVLGHNPASQLQLSIPIIFSLAGDRGDSHFI